MTVRITVDFLSETTNTRRKLITSLKCHTHTHKILPTYNSIPSKNIFQKTGGSSGESHCLYDSETCGQVDQLEAFSI